MLLSVYSCGSPAFDPWTQGGYTCWAGPHLALVIVNTVAAAGLVAGGVYLTAVATSSPFLSAARSARSHGRADAGACLVDTLLVIVLCAFRGKVQAAISAVVALAGAGAWLGLAVAFLPHYDPSLNSEIAAALSLHVWAAVCGVLAQVVPGFSLSSVLLLGFVPSAGCGHSLAEYRWRLVAGTPVASMSSVYSFEIKVCVCGVQLL